MDDGSESANGHTHFAEALAFYTPVQVLVLDKSFASVLFIFSLVAGLQSLQLSPSHSGVPLKQTVEDDVVLDCRPRFEVVTVLDDCGETEDMIALLCISMLFFFFLCTL